MKNEDIRPDSPEESPGAVEATGLCVYLGFMAGGAGPPDHFEEEKLNQIIDQGAPQAPVSQAAAAAATSTPGIVNGDALSIARYQLEDMKAEEIVEIDLVGKTSIADAMLIASGRSDRHVGAIASHVVEALKQAGHGPVRVEGLPACDWVLIDVGDIIVHVFRPEVRGFYNLEKMWGADRPKEQTAPGQTVV